jgi:hypothetical protein
LLFHVFSFFLKTIKQLCGLFSSRKMEKEP